MRFKDFITRQRVAILIIGLMFFILAIGLAYVFGYNSLRGELAIDLAASAFTVVFTALVIDYLGVREENDKTQNAAGLAEDELRATCFRVKWRLARLFGMDRHSSDARENISNRQQARDYLERVRSDVDHYLESNSIMDTSTVLQSDQIGRYLERLETALTELEQTLMLYEYAMSYSLRDRVLNLRTELQVADNILGFIGTEDLNDANRSLIRVLSQSIYDQIEEVLGHGSRSHAGITIHAKTPANNV